MRQCKTKWVLGIMCICILLPLIACAPKEQDIRSEISTASNSTYLIEQLSVDYSGKLGLFTAFEDNIYFTTTDDLGKLRLYSCAVDGMRLKEYESFIVPEDFGVAALTVSAEKIWAVLSENRKIGDIEELHYHLGSIKNDDTGFNVEAFDSINGSKLDRMSVISSAVFDDKGKLYVLWALPTPTLSVYDPNTTPGLLFELSIYPGDKIIESSDGNCAVMHRNPDGIEIKTVNSGKKTWGDVKKIDLIASRIYDGAKQWAYIDDGNYVYGIDQETNKLSALFSWVECGIEPPYKVIPMSNGSFLTEQFTMDGSGKRLAIVKKDEMSGKKAPITLTLAVLDDADNLYSSAAIKYNSSHADVKIQLMDYAAYYLSTPSAGETQMAIDFITGNSPDIIALTNYPSARLAAKGLLEDLYPYIDGDADISRDNFFDNILSSAEINDCLYELIPSFYIQTVVGSAVDFGERYSWSIDEFQELKNSGKYQSMFGEALSRGEFLENILNYNGSQFVDNSNNTCSFDSPNFIGVLEMAAEIPEKAKYGPESGHYTTWYDEPYAIVSGEQALKCLAIGDPSLDLERAMFKDGFSFIGFPSSDSNGSSIYPTMSLGISSMSSHKDEAWDFIKSLVLEDAQTNQYLGGMPSTKIGMDKLIESYRYRAENFGDSTFSSINLKLEFVQDPDYCVPKFMALINSLDKINRPDASINEIVSEEASALFAGERSAEEVARLIQSRVSLYLAEQG